MDTIPSASFARSALTQTSTTTKIAQVAALPFHYVGKYWKIASVVLLILVMMKNRMWPFHRRIHLSLDDGSQ